MKRKDSKIRNRGNIYGKAISCFKNSTDDRKRKRKWQALVMTAILAFSLCACGAKGGEAAAGGTDSAREPEGGVLTDTSGEEYYMVTFASGIEYWKGCYAGFQKAAALHGSKTVYEGASGLEVTEAAAVLEQVVAKNPAGIAVTCVDPDAYKDIIDSAVEKGIPVVTFDSDSPQSQRYAYLGTGNVNAGAQAADYLAQQLGHKGKVAVVSMPGNLTQEQRTQGFEDYLKQYEPDMEVVQVANGEADQTKAAGVTAGIIQANPEVTGIYTTNAQSGIGVATAVEEAGKAGEIKIVSFDTDEGTLDAIKAGAITASIAQGTQQMGFWSFEMLFMTRNGLVVDDWKEKGLSPLPASIDTGVSIVTKDNADSFYPAAE